MRTSTLADHKKRAVQEEVNRVALKLFFAQGFDKTTVDDIAHAAGISRTTFFRYFAAKEDVVLFGNEQVGRLVLSALEERPMDEPVWASLRIALEKASSRVDMPDGGLKFVQMTLTTPSIRRRHFEKQRAWQDLLAPEVSRRLPAHTGSEIDVRAAALVGAAFACLETSVEVWAASNGRSHLLALLDQAMGIVSTGEPATSKASFDALS
jgi:AcrR family transcriptional regulator